MVVTNALRKFLTLTVPKLTESLMSSFAAPLWTNKELLSWVHTVSLPPDSTVMYRIDYAKYDNQNQ